MKRAWLAGCLLSFGASLVAPLPVSADALLDPIIGVRGLGRGGSQDIFNESSQGFQDCGAFFGDMSDAGYLCAPYNLTETFANGLYAVDLSFTDNGQNIPFNLLSIDDSFGGFTQATQVGASTIRLFGGSGQNGALLCGEVACEGRANPESEYLTTAHILNYSPGDDAVVFISPYMRGDGPFLVSLTNPQNTPVPEPTTLLLMATGLAALGGARWRQRARAN